jgi:transcriptional regulator|tara:strand:+ start:1075 stop:1659 length:585 start_codon:yes stop_codon:yes gene_type:complete
MYIPNSFEIINDDEIFAFIESNNFGQLISSVGNRPFATHMPFLVSENRAQLIGHVAKLNPQHSQIDGQEVLITLQGPHDYISPSWYGSPGVPTWNYQSVHLYGVCKVFSNAERLKHVLDALTIKHESSFEKPWVPTYKASMLSAIVGLEITIKEIQCKYKLGQNRSTQDQQQVAVQLEKLGSVAMAKAMRRGEV